MGKEKEDVNSSLVGTTDGCGSGGSPSKSKGQQVSQLVDKPVDEAPANVPHQIADNHQGEHLTQVEVASPDQACVAAQEQVSLGNAVTSEPDPLHESSGSIAAFELPALSDAMAVAGEARAIAYTNKRTHKSSSTRPKA